MNPKPQQNSRRHNKNRRRRPRRRNSKPLKVSFADRLAPLMPQLTPSEPPPRTRPLPAPPPKSARSVLGLLAAATGLALAARRVHLELLPGEPVTVLVCERGRVRAAFMLPLSEAEARKAFGRPAKAPRDRLLEQLFEEERRGDMPSLDAVLDQEDRHAC